MGHQKRFVCQAMMGPAKLVDQSIAESSISIAHAFGGCLRLPPAVLPGKISMLLKGQFRPVKRTPH
jgi:hypothetical protein